MLEDSSRKDVNHCPAGATHLSWLNTEVFRECYKEGQPYDDFVKLTFRNCQIVGQLYRLSIEKGANSTCTADTKGQLQGSLHSHEQDRARKAPSLQIQQLLDLLLRSPTTTTTNLPVSTTEPSPRLQPP